MKKISIGSIFGEAYGLTFGNLGLFARVAIVPFLLILAMNLAVLLFASPKPAGWIGIAQNILTIIIEVPLLTSWHRFALLPRNQSLPTLGFAFTLREIRFFGYLLLMSMSFTVPLFVIGAAGQGAGLAAGLLFLVLAIGVLLLWARVGLVFPASAVGDPVRLADSWRITEGNGWRIFWLMVLISLPFAGATLLIAMVFGTIAFMTKDMSIYPLMSIPMVFLAVLSAGIYASTLSVVYRELAGYDPARFTPA
jgi:hypothetical protein